MNSDMSRDGGMSGDHLGEGNMDTSALPHATPRTDTPTGQSLDIEDPAIGQPGMSASPSGDAARVNDPNVGRRGGSPADDVSQAQWENDLEASALDDAEASEGELDSDARL